MTQLSAGQTRSGSRVCPTATATNRRRRETRVEIRIRVRAGVGGGHGFVIVFLREQPGRERHQRHRKQEGEVNPGQRARVLRVMLESCVC